MPIATSTIIFTGAAVGLAGAAAQTRKRWLPGRKGRLVTLLMVEKPNKREDETSQQEAKLLQELLQSFDNTYQALFQNYVDPLLLGERHEEINAMRLKHQSLEEAQVEYHINQQIGINILAMATAAVGFLGAPVFLGVSVGLSIYSATDLIEKSYKHLVKERRVSDELVVLLADLGALAAGLYIANAATALLYFVGEKFLVITENRARSRLVDSWSQLPRSAYRLEDGEEVEVAIAELQVGDTVIVAAGQIVPVDGEVLEGNALIDQHMLTGESQPAEKEAGDTVFAATLVFSGTLYVRVTKTGQDTTALQITEILNNTLSYETQTQARARRWADQWAPLSLGMGAVAGATVGVNGMIGIWNAGLGSNAKITAPIALLSYLNMALEQNILIKDGRSMDLLRDVDTIVFDKTGTLTMEEPTLRAVHRFDDADEEALLRFAAAAEKRQAHPIARAILRAAEDYTLPEMHDAHYEIGYGIQAVIGDTRIQLGSRRFMTMCDVELTEASDAVQAQCDSVGHSLVYLALDGILAGALELEPTLRPEAADVIEALHERGLEIAIISGDQEEPTRQLATTLGIDRYFANTLPENKASLVSQLQDEGRSVCFVGDGINDGIALKTAHISVSMRGATTVAMDAAQILLIDQNLMRLPMLFDQAQDYAKNMSAGYLSTVIPGLAFVGSVFTFGFGVYPALIVYNASLVLGVFISLAPARKNKAIAGQLPASEGYEILDVPEETA